MGVPEVRRGFVPAIILAYLIKRMGTARAREFILRGEILDALTSQQRGLVTEVVNDELLQQKVMEFAAALARTTSALAISLTKDLLSRVEEMNHADALEYAANINAVARKTDDFQKGMLAFLRKENLEW